MAIITFRIMTFALSKLCNLAYCALLYLHSHAAYLNIGQNIIKIAVMGKIREEILNYFPRRLISNLT